MSVSVTIKGLTYIIPERSERGWGGQVSDYLQAVADAINGSSSAGDIANLTNNINNTNVLTNVDNLAFDNTSVKGAVIYYNINRTTSTTQLVQEGQLTIRYKSSTNSWEWVDEGTGDNALVTFSITSAGQVQYTAEIITGTGYSATLSFRAFALS